MYSLCVLTSMLLLLGNSRAECPHKRAGLLKWSDDQTWGSSGKPKTGENLDISTQILLDETPAELHNITIKSGGALVFSPEVKLELRARNIFVHGAMEIGSEECPYNQSLTITLTGTRQDHVHETNPKVILVQDGGTLEIHGEPRRSWTKLNKTIVPTKLTQNVYFEHKLQDNYASFNGHGIMAYTFNVVGTTVTVKKAGLYFLKTESQNLTDHINAVEDGDVLMMAVQEKLVTKDPTKQDNSTYEALEKLVSGNVTGNSILRTIPSDGTTWAFVYKKGTKESYQEETKPFGTTSSAKYTESSNLIFLAESIGDPSATFRQTVNFKIMNLEALYQMVEVIDDVTTWRPGDTIVIASTDYDWEQAEKREIVFCSDCNRFQVRINEPVNFMHFGKILHNALDMRAEVALLSRKVVIRGEMEPSCPEYNNNCNLKAVRGKDTFGVHTKVLKGYKIVRIENIEIYNAGQHTDLGRYPFHFHLCLGKDPGAPVPYIRGCSIHDTYARCATIHGSHGVTVMDNACYYHMGHGYFLEDGGEINNTFDGNLAISTLKGTGQLEPSDTRPAAFWITNPLTYILNNNAAGGEGTGIWVIYPLEPLPPSREFNIMEPYEARKTNLLQFTNNVAHSYTFNGIHIGGRIEESRETHCCNIWQPLLDPKVNSSGPINVYFKYLTGYKNGKFNMWIEGSLLQVSKISVADSTNGIMVSNEKLLDHAGTLSESVIIGDSENKGEPAEGLDRSITNPDKPHSGVSIWRGVNRYYDLWFDGFTSDYKYDNAAIMKKRGDRYFFSVTNSFKNALFAYDDAEGGNYAMSGSKTDPGWEEQRDGEIGAGFSWYQNTTNGVERWYVVKPDGFSAAGADCRLRPNWRMAMCKTKYGTWRITHPGPGAFYLKKSFGIFVRDKYPGAQLSFDLEKSAGPSVVLNGTETYTFHVTGKVPTFIKFSAEGIEKDETLRIGFCIPDGVSWDIKSKFPYNLNTKAKFTEVNSLAELDKRDSNLDGKKFFYNQTTGMLYYKYLGVKDRKPDERFECADDSCPVIQVVFSGNRTGRSADCREKVYGSRLNDHPPALPTITETFKANGGSSPPEGYGAGLQRPFTSRKRVNGKYTSWSEWSACTKTCGGGVQYKTRECSNPMPEGGGGGCLSDHIKSRDCSKQSCG
ncbi:cell migration-inducing and hyaluronan-binding protein-like [Mercenaria mercenaria]|uniref:cell migration-inducing and hyaluronan-binding protein-like n=1 Tax=Mercenaria mercenaria TaxID=6596 RepID=UPI00234F51D3|nr:cell migration-inducing and hyaluronan-binding protein-like [Mercenaria mercenaria]